MEGYSEAVLSDVITLEADVRNLDKVLGFVSEQLERVGCAPKTAFQITLSVEEIFVNIASYAYVPEKGDVTVRVGVGGAPAVATIQFIDRGIPYDPLAKEDPDVTLSAEERGVGGLGIYITKKSMDNIVYEYKDGQNILTISKNL